MSIFNKQRAPASPTGVTRQEHVTQHAATSSYTVISEGAVVNGELSSNDKLVIEGRVEGNVAVKNAVIIGKTGYIKADISATTLEVLGKISGDVTATDRVTIGSTGSIEGNIRAPKLMISEGAHFRGNIDMSQQGGDPGEPPQVGQEKRFELRKDIGLRSAVTPDA